MKLNEYGHPIKTSEFSQEEFYAVLYPEKFKAKLRAMDRKYKKELKP